MDLAAGALFVVHTGTAAWLSVRWARRLQPQSGGCELALSGLVVFASLCQLSLLLLGCVGWLSGGPLAALLVGLVLAEVFQARYRGRLQKQIPAGSTPALAEPSQPSQASWPMAPRLIVAAACAWSAWAILGSGTLFAWDSLTYHSVAPAWWLQRASLELAPFNYQAYYPLGTELGALWFMMAHRVDAHANLAMLCWLGILISAWTVHGHRLGQRPWFVALALAGFLLSPQIQDRLAFFSSGDLSMAAVLSAMIAFTWVPTRESRPTARALLSGLAGGLAMGMKPTAAPYVALVGLLWAAPRRATASTGTSTGVSAFVRVVVFGLGTLLTGSFWYFRNLWLTGNPLFPAQVGPFDGPFDKLAQQATSQMPVLREGWAEWETWSTLLEAHLSWPLPLGLASLLGALAALVIAFRPGPRSPRAHLRLLLVCGLVYALLFPTLPFSGSVNRPEAQPNYLIRYVTFPFMIGLLLLPSLWPLRKLPQPQGERPLAAPARSVPGLLGFVLLLFTLAGIALATPAREQLTAEALYSWHRGVLGPGWEKLEELPDGSRIAVYSRDPPSHSLIYPLFGRRLQHTPVAVNKDGTRRKALHTEAPQADRSWWWEFDAPVGVGGTRLLANLVSSGAQYLMLNNWPPTLSKGPGQGQDKDPFVIRRRVMPSLSGRRSVFESRGSEIWDLRQGVDAPPAERTQDSSADPPK